MINWISPKNMERFISIQLIYFWPSGRLEEALQSSVFQCSKFYLFALHVTLGAYTMLMEHYQLHQWLHHLKSEIVAHSGL